MIQVIGTIIEAIIGTLIASFLFYKETRVNKNPKQNLAVAYQRIKDHVEYHQLEK